jgi:hypothetical protein
MSSSNRTRTNQNGSADCINISLKSNGTDNHDTDDKSTTSYIISQNRKFQQEIKFVTIENISLTKNVDESEHELGRAERSNTHLKGLLKNFHAIAEDRKIIAEKQESIARNHIMDVNDYVKDFNFLMKVILAFSVLYLAIMFMMTTIMVFISCAIMIGTFLYVFYLLSLFELSKNSNIHAVIREKKAEIKKTEESLDFIHEYIESI